MSTFSPVFEDKMRVEHRDEKGKVYVSYEPIDYEKITASLGSFKNWKLESLLKAGINPEQMSIHTGFNSRLDGFSAIDDAVATLDGILVEQNNNNNE